MDGDEASIATLQHRFSSPTKSFLIQAGARLVEAEEVVTSLWADLLAPVGERPPRLRRYDGSCALQTWLNTVALNQLLTQKRREQRWQRVISAGSSPIENEGEPVSEPSWMANADRSEPAEAPLLELMRGAIEAAFLACDPEDFVLVHLAHFDRLQGTELAAMFGCDASVISRRIKKAGRHIAATTLWTLRQTDPWLELKWDDFTELCRTATPACFGVE
jgi:RNA polymerase sigma factor (sigma-70 family)